MIRVGDSPELRAAVLALRAADASLTRRIHTATTGTMGPVWRQLVDSKATTPVEQRVVAVGARIAPGNPPAALAAQSASALTGGLVPSAMWAPIELGTTDRDRYTGYTRRSPSGGVHAVVRRTRRQLRPHKKSGYVALPAFAEIAPRMVSLWAQLIIKLYADALAGRESP